MNQVCPQRILGVSPETHQGFKILVMDNASDSGTQRVLTQYSKIIDKEISDINAPLQQFSIHRLDRNVGYAGALDAAISLVETSFMAWLNDDAVPDPLWLSTLETILSSQPEAAAIGSHLVNQIGRAHV